MFCIIIEGNLRVAIRSSNKLNRFLSFLGLFYYLFDAFNALLGQSNSVVEILFSDRLTSSVQGP